MKLFRNSGHARLMLGAAVCALTLGSGAAWAQAKPINIAPQTLASALHDFGSQTGHQIFFAPELAASKVSQGAAGATDEQTALAQILQGTGLTFRREANAYIIEEGEGASAPQSESAAGGGADGTVEALIVTAQKKEEQIQDVPIAISAFSQKDLEAQKIEGGFDLLKAIPNVTFSKNNFTSYNFSIRGVGTKAVSATTDAGVAVAFNNTSIIQNRLFEQEYFDVERVEVLRGPQGTLYGRNATSGVINVISATPRLSEFDGWVKGEVGNYATKRLSAMVNIPLVEDVLGIRLAGALTSRDGYDYNRVTRNAINGRDLWSTRLTIGFQPNDKLRADLIWERFEEDDNRSRTGKQLCHNDPGPDTMGGSPMSSRPNGFTTELMRALFSQGCVAGGLYEDAAFGMPNGRALPIIYFPLAFRPIATWLGTDSAGVRQAVIQDVDPYGGMTQSRDMREIDSVLDPIYRASADLIELNVSYDLTPSLRLSSQTAYVEDTTYSFQDFNRFNSNPVFTDTSTLVGNQIYGVYKDFAPGGEFCDPQIGCSKTIAGFDIAMAEGTQFSQEFRIQSDFAGPVNFSAGVNYTDFQTEVNYYIMFNLLTALALTPPFNAAVPFNFNQTTGVVDRMTCAGSTLFAIWTPALNGVPMPTDHPNSPCPYVDPNPVESINGEGHNYFRSRNPYDLKSTAAFGEVYWQINETLKFTGGLRYTDDRKNFIPVPTQLLTAPSISAVGTVAKGYPERPLIKQKWQEWTGRIGLDWKPELTFTDETMLYAFYSHGYKGGGVNPPRPGFASKDDFADFMERGLFRPDQLNLANLLFLAPRLVNDEYSETFEPEYVDAFELGAKNTLLGGGLLLNTTAFYYDYKGYQISQIRDRTAVNENFDAKVWGLEFEALFSPTRNLRFNANLGYLNTEVADGEKSIDIINRTQGHPDYTIAKPWVQLPSNCIVPVHVAKRYVDGQGSWAAFCGGVGGWVGAATPVRDSMFGDLPYNSANYNGENGTEDINGGAGIFDDLSGNELPNAPHWTTNIGAQYSFDLLDGSWRATVRGDAYWQSQSYHRIYNYEPYDKLRGWYNLNLSVWIERPEDDLKIELYAKNLLDQQPLTDAFLNSDDTGLTTNVFTLDPRLIGLSIRKGF